MKFAAQVSLRRKRGSAFNSYVRQRRTMKGSNASKRKPKSRTDCSHIVHLHKLWACVCVCVCAGALSFSLSCSLFRLLRPNHDNDARCKQFSVASPSGIRRASSLTTSLELRLGPKRTPDNMKPEAKTIDDGVEGSSGGVGWGLHAGGTAEVLTPMVT